MQHATQSIQQTAAKLFAEFDIEAQHRGIKVVPHLKPVSGTLSSLDELKVARFKLKARWAVPPFSIRFTGCLVQSSIGS